MLGNLDATLLPFKERYQPCALGSTGRILRALAASWLWSGAGGFWSPRLVSSAGAQSREAQKAVRLGVKGLVLPPVVWAANSVVTQTAATCSPLSLGADTYSAIDERMNE